MAITNPKISVVVPVYNVEKYLNQCIDSLLQQTLKDIEIILINDGSTDNSASICDSYGAKYDNVKVVHQENHGISIARNKGIDVARGTYIGFVDSDDYVAHHMYEHLLNLAEIHQADIVKAAHVRFRDHSDIHVVTLPSDLGDCSIEGGELAFCKYYKNKINVTVWDSIYHRKIFRLVQFPDGRINEDEFFTPKALFVARKVCFSNEPLYCHRLRPGSIMQTFSLKRLDSVVSCIDIDRFLRIQGMDSICADQLARRKVHRVNSFLKGAAQSFGLKKYIHACRKLSAYYPARILLGLVSTKMITMKSRLHILLFLIHPIIIYAKEQLFRIPIIVRNLCLQKYHS
jgi:glycosyltransferase involved in cell wall biosynthesis